MRQERTTQTSIFDLFAGHEIGRELKAMSEWLDEHRTVPGLVAGDLRRHRVKEKGRRGLPAEAVLRCALLKQHRQLSYEELAFHLEDSASFRAFARLPISWTPKKSVLQKTIGAIRAETWEAINRTLLASARRQKLEDGSVVRLDSTVTSALMHEPSDSSLLWDAVRVMVRLLREADGLLGGIGLTWRDHRRAAKQRARAIQFTRGQPKRIRLYRELIKITRATLGRVDSWDWDSLSEANQIQGCFCGGSDGGFGPPDFERRAVESRVGPHHRGSSHARLDGTRQPDVRRGGAVDRAHRSTLARPAGGVRQLEQRFPALQPMECKGHLASHLHSDGRRSGF
jgi:IS5 family transposase